MNIDKLKDALKNIRMTPAAWWALTGGGVGGVVGASTARKGKVKGRGKDKEKDRDKAYDRQVLRNALIGAGIGSGAGYAANKGVSNVIAHVGAVSPFGYTLKDKTEGLTTKQILKYMVTTPNLETIKERLAEGNLDDVVSMTRAELLARGLNVFSDSKGSVLQPLTAETRAGLAAPVLSLAKKNSPPSKVMEFKPKDERGQDLGYILGNFFYAGPEGKGVSSYKDIPVGTSYYDKWDFDLHKGENLMELGNEPGEPNWKSLLRSVKSDPDGKWPGIKDLLKGTPRGAIPHGIQWSNVVRHIVDKTLTDPVTIVGVNKIPPSDTEYF